MYDYDLGEIEEIGWDRFVAQAWESIFVGYRSMSGIRTMGRRWSDLLQGGLGCSEDVADRLVRYQVVDRQDRDLMAVRDPEQLVAAMDEVLADIGFDLADETDVAGIGPAERDALLAAHARLRGFLRDGSAEPDEGDPDA